MLLLSYDIEGNTMLPPKPFKFVCPKCGYLKIVTPKSDALSPVDFFDICPKCKTKMEQKELGIFDGIMRLFKL